MKKVYIFFGTTKKQQQKRNDTMIEYVRWKLYRKFREIHQKWREKGIRIIIMMMAAVVFVALLLLVQTQKKII